MDKEEIFICDCHSYNHQIIFYKDEEDNELFISVHLSTHKNFFKRLWYGLRYAFGYKSRFGAWDSFIFKPKDEDKLKKFLNSNTDEKNKSKQ